MSNENKVMVILNVHENGVWKDGVDKLQKGIESAYHAHSDSSAKLRFVWFQIPPGQGWLAGAPSSASTLLVPSPDDITQERREKLMGQICDDWMQVTGCSVDEIIVNAISQSEGKRYLDVSQTRFDPKRAKRMKLKMLLSLFTNKIRKGYMTTSVNNV